MALLINTNAVSKAYGATPLFLNVNLTIYEGDRLGVIGPNGSGKSTLLEILAGHREPDSGEVIRRKGTRLAYVAQDSQFAPGITVRSVVRQALEAAGVPESEWLARESETLGRTGFENFDLAVDLTDRCPDLVDYDVNHLPEPCGHQEPREDFLNAIDAFRNLALHLGNECRNLMIRSKGIPSLADSIADVERLEQGLFGSVCLPPRTHIVAIGLDLLQNFYEPLLQRTV